MRTPSRRPRAGHHLPSKLQHVELDGQALTKFQGNAKLNSESEMLNNFHNKKYHPLWQAHTTLIPLRHRFSPLIKSRDVNYYNRYRMQMFYVCFNYELKVNVICTHGMDISCARDQWNLQLYLCSQIALCFPCTTITNAKIITPKTVTDSICSLPHVAFLKIQIFR